METAIRKRREELGITREQLAADVGASYGYIVRLEKGEQVCNVLLGIRIARKLGVTVEELWGRSA